LVVSLFISRLPAFRVFITFLGEVYGISDRDGEWWDNK
jgi:hypothetical protein